MALWGRLLHHNLIHRCCYRRSFRPRLPSPRLGPLATPGRKLAILTVRSQALPNRGPAQAQRGRRLYVRVNLPLPRSRRAGASRCPFLMRRRQRCKCVCLCVCVCVRVFVRVMVCRRELPLADAGVGV